MNKKENKLIKNIRLNILKKTYEAKSSHIGSCYSIVEILYVLYFLVLKNTDLKNGDVFSENCDRCTGGSGHETDKIAENSPEVTLIAKGTNPDNGGADMIYYQRNGGGQVFSASSITFTRTLMLAELSSQITKNVIEEFTK